MKNKIAMITGATGGIGQEFAKILFSKGYSLILVGRNKEKLKKLDSEFNSAKVTSVICDLSKQRDLFNLTKKYSKVDFLINNAAFCDYGLFTDKKWEDQEKLINVNITALTYLCHYYLKEMLKNHSGQILNVSSTAAAKPAPLTSIYAASKAYVLLFSKSLSLEAKGTNVKVSCLLPGPTATEFWEIAGMGKRVEKRIKHFDNPRKVADFGISLIGKGKISGIYGYQNNIKQIIKNLLPEKIWSYLIIKHMFSR